MTKTTENRKRLRGIYAQLVGLERAWPADNTRAEVMTRANKLIAEFCKLLDLPIEDFAIPTSLSWNNYNNELYFSGSDSLPFVKQAISYLVEIEHVSERIQEIGSLYNVIKHEELKRRCSDLLSSPGPYDRAINQATQVLENVIRQKAQDGDKMTGTALVGRYIKQDPDTSTLVVSDDKAEQEGFSNMIKGVMLVFRNDTHHRISDRFTREEALQVCGFIDNLISIIDKAHVNNPV